MPDYVSGRASNTNSAMPALRVGVALVTSLLILVAHADQLGVRRFTLAPGSDGAPRSAYAVPLELKEGHVRARGLLRNGSLALGGSVGTGYFYATLSLGTPPRQFTVIIDTGSTITYIPCVDCKQCGKHQNSPFDPTSSSTVTHLKCHSPKCNCGSPACQCMMGDQCYYSRYYAEKSSSAGFLLEDRFAFPDSDEAPVNVVFGCVQEETGLIKSQVADGIMGMGNNNNAFQSQLVEQKLIDNVFSLCYGFPKGGTLMLGDVSVKGAKEKMQYAPLASGKQIHYYTSTLTKAMIGDHEINVKESDWATGYGTVFDSGTTFSYFPTSAFQKVAKYFEKVAKEKGLEKTPGSDPQYDDICWKGMPASWEDLEGYFPTMTIEFAGGAVLRCPPYRYLFVIGTGKYCLGIMDNGANGGTLLGGISVRNVMVQYDRRNHRVGFYEVDCNNVEYEDQAANAPSDGEKPQGGADKSSGEGQGQGSETEKEQGSDVSPAKGEQLKSIPSHKISVPSPPPPELVKSPPPIAVVASPLPTTLADLQSTSPPAAAAASPKPEPEVGGGQADLGGASYDEVEVPLNIASEEAGGSGSLITAIIVVLAVAAAAQLAYTYRNMLANAVRSVMGYQQVPDTEPYSTGLAKMSGGSV